MVLATEVAVWETEVVAVAVAIAEAKVVVGGAWHASVVDVDKV